MIQILLITLLLGLVSVVVESTSKWQNRNRFFLFNMVCIFCICSWQFIFHNAFKNARIRNAVRFTTF